MATEDQFYHHVGKVWIAGASGGTGPSTPGSALPVMSAGLQYETVAAGQTNQAMGATGATGDYLEGVLCVVATAATSTVSIKDGAGSAISVLPAAVGGGVGTYYIPIMCNSVAGAWQITTGAGVSAIGIGRFT